MGLAMAALGPLLMFAASLLWGLDTADDAPFFLITAAIPLVGAFLLLRFPGLWPKIVGVVLSILVGLALHWTAFGLFAPNSFFDFAPGILVVPGAILGLVGSIAAIVAQRRGKAGAAPADGEAKTVRIAFSAVVGLAAISGILTFLGKETVDDSQADSQVSLSDFEFDKESYSFDGGSTVLVRNDDPFLHTFTVEELDIDEALTPGSEILVEIPDNAGDYLLFCDPHTEDAEDPSEDDMTADLTVE
jgi:hypothetical protein